MGAMHRLSTGLPLYEASMWECRGRWEIYSSDGGSSASAKGAVGVRKDLIDCTTGSLLHGNFKGDEDGNTEKQDEC
jgi:hypothetical protein